MILEQLVPTLDLCQQLRAAGFPQDTALAWYPEHCDDYEAEAPTSLWPDEWKRIVVGQPVVCVREEMEDHESLCAAPTAEEILDQLPRKMRFDFSLRIYLEPGGCYVGWQDWDGTNVLEKAEEEGLPLIIAAAHAFLWRKKEVSND